ncbi:MAG: hypothetical protein WAO28_00985 [Candidatus Microsaccharimonas sp.]
MTQRKDLMFATITKWHDGQFRGDVPVTFHCHNVAEIATYALRTTHSSLDESLLEDIYLAGLGHDLLEDTEVTRDELREKFGDRVLDYIEQLTNHQDDQHTSEYMQQIFSAPEEVRIVKYADLIDNTTSVLYNLHALGLEWGNGFFRPIMENTIKTLEATEFTTFAETAKLLNASARMAITLLSDRLDSEAATVQNAS